MADGNRGAGGNGGDYEQMLPDMPKIGDLLQRLRASGPLLPALIGLVIALLWLSTGLYVVEPGEAGVVRQFGREVAQTGQGLNYHWPRPIQQVDVVNIAVIRRIEVGFRTVGGGVTRTASGALQRVAGRSHRVVDESLMLTGDENIVDAQMIVQYQINDPSRYLFRLKDPELVLRAGAEVALRAAVGSTTIDEVLTVGRLQVQESTFEFLQKLMTLYESGILVTEVKLQTVDPPDAVKDSFAEVVRAREDREKLINQARGYREDIIPKARGEAQKQIREAEGYRTERVLRAQGDASRFEALATAYRKSPGVTRERLHLETVERVLAKSDKVLVDADIGRGMLPFLPLRPGPNASGQGEVAR